MFLKVLLFFACLAVIAVAQQYEAPSASSSNSPIGYPLPSKSKSPIGYTIPSASKSKSPEKSPEGKPSKSQTPMSYGYKYGGVSQSKKPEKSKAPECEFGSSAFMNAYKESKEMNKECGYKVMEPMKVKEGMTINPGSYLDIYNDVEVDDDFMIDTGSYVGVYGGKVNVKSTTIKGTYDVYANNDYMINSYGPATIDGYLNVRLPANYDFKNAARIVILKFASLIGAFKGYRVSYDNNYSYGGYKRAVGDFEVRDNMVDAEEVTGQEVPADVVCTATECAIVSRVAPEATVSADAPKSNEKLALAIGLGAGLPIVVALAIAVAVVSRRRRAQEVTAKNYDVEAPQARTNASTASSFQGASTSKMSSASAGVGSKSSLTSAEQVSSASSAASGTASTGSNV